MAITRNTDLHLIRTTLDNIISGKEKALSVEKLRAMVMDKEAESLDVFLKKTQGQILREGPSAYRIPDTEQYQLQQLEMGRALLSASLKEIINQTDSPSQYNSSEEEEEDNENNGGGVTAMDTEQDQPDEEDEAEWLWIPKLGLPPPFPEYSWLNAIFYRVNGSQLLLNATAKQNRDAVFKRKVMRYQNAHVRVIQYLDNELHDPCDDNIDVQYLLSLYGKGAGKSQYACDRSLIRITQTRHENKPRPLEIITQSFPGLMWLPEQVATAIENRTISLNELTPYLDDTWSPLQEDEHCPPPAIETHKLYYGVVYILNQCQRYILQEGIPSIVVDALWAYYASFVELFHFCLSRPERRMDDAFLLHPLGTTRSRDQQLVFNDKATPWEMYGTLDIRAFCAGDLPDLYHVLVSIPLWGEQRTPSYFLGKIYQKSLPFACQRRHLIKLVVKCSENAVFFKVFSKLVWVFMANLYPGDLRTPPEGARLGMRSLLRIKELTDNKELLLQTLTRTDPNGSVSNGGPLVVFTMFRMHILYMTQTNLQYVEQARKCIDWDHFKTDVLKLAAIIRSHAPFPEDLFAQARRQLSKTVKSPHSKVHRFRRRSLAISLMEQFNETLEKVILKDRQNHSSDYIKLIELETSSFSSVGEREKRFFEETIIGRHLREAGEKVIVGDFEYLLKTAIEVTDNAQRYYSKLLNMGRLKSNILNMLIRLPPDERTTRDAFNLLTLPEFGGISYMCVEILCELVNTYHVKAAPKEFKQRIEKISMTHFMVCCFYFNMVSLLEKISFVSLDADTVRRIDVAMTTRRHHLYPGQEVPEDIYNVSVALCCEKICSMLGYGKHGNRRVSYDSEGQAFICSNGKSLKKRTALTATSTGAGVHEDLEGGDDEQLDAEIDMAEVVLQAQNDGGVDFNASSVLGVGDDLIADASAMKGRGLKKSAVMHDRKLVRNERKAFSKIPCGQPVLTFSLRGRALVWGNTLENKTQYMHCPQCGSLHVYTILNFSASETGKYRCSECTRQELIIVEHNVCAYCGKNALPDNHLEVACPDVDPADPTHFDPLEVPANTIQNLYFCKSHFRIAQRYVRGKGVIKKDLWKLIKYVCDQRMIQIARGNYKGTGGGGGGGTRRMY